MGATDSRGRKWPQPAKCWGWILSTSPARAAWSSSSRKRKRSGPWKSCRQLPVARGRPSSAGSPVKSQARGSAHGHGYQAHSGSTLRRAAAEDLLGSVFKVDASRDGGQPGDPTRQREGQCGSLFEPANAVGCPAGPVPEGMGQHPARCGVRLVDSTSIAFVAFLARWGGALRKRPHPTSRKQTLVPLRVEELSTRRVHALVGRRSTALGLEQIGGQAFER